MLHILISTRSQARNVTFKTSKRCYSSVKRPLRVLFCGSDDFSISSLRALHSLQKSTNDSSIFASIDVVCRPGKRSGRGLKKIREVPIKNVAEELCLPIHEIDTFTGWTPPKPQQEQINLIVAVSFGLFVPPRILRGAKYGGINVHPSLLPDFRGPAPLQHTLLAGEKYTGVTVQTLSETGFDQGQILAQTPLPGVNIPNPDSCTYPELLELVKPLAGDILSKYVYDTYLTSYGYDHNKTLPSVELQSSDRSHMRHAPKITTADREVDWEKWTAEDILRRDRVLGRLWTNVRLQDGTAKRVIFEGLELFPDFSTEVRAEESQQKPHYNTPDALDNPMSPLTATSVIPGSKPSDSFSAASIQSLSTIYRIGGLPLLTYRHGKSLVVVTGPDRQLLRINSVTIEGRNKQDASELCSLGVKVEQ